MNNFSISDAKMRRLIINLDPPTFDEMLALEGFFILTIIPTPTGN